LGLDGEKVFSPEKVIKRKLEETGTCCPVTLGPGPSRATGDSNVV